MEFIRDIAAGVILGFGAVLYVVGAIGLLRMPDMFTRLHAASVMETVGASLLVIGMMVAAGWSLVTAKLAFLLGILLFSGPVAAHALANAALTAGVVPLLSEDRTAGRKRRDGRATQAGGKGGKPSKR